MGNINHFCLSCFQYTLDSNGLCRHCGFNMHAEIESPHHLPVRSVLGGKYLCGRVLGEGGFGITYAGWDINLEVKVAIKEYYPQGAATRNTTINDTVNSMAGNMAEVFQQGRERFIDEAKRLAKFHNLPGIVVVRDFFQENNTAYIVMEFVQGVTLKDYLDSQGGRLPYDTVLTLFKPLVESLAQVHKTGIIHRDISPDNIMVMQNGLLCLIDFGAARDFTENNRSLSVLLKPGYAPEEQYRSRGKQGPWTDIYALCATLYRAIEGEKPPEAMERMLEDTVTGFHVPIPESIAQTILKGLSVRQEGRWQSVEELIAALYPLQQERAQPVYTPVSSVLPQKNEKPKPQKKVVSLKPAALPPAPAQNQKSTTPTTTNSKKKTPYFAAVALVLVASIGISVIFGNNKENTEALGVEGSSSPYQAQGAVPEGTTPLPGVQMAVTASKAGADGHSMVILPDGSLWGWGYNGYGQLGNGTTDDTASPIQVMENVQMVAIGPHHSTAIKQDGTLWTWGRDKYSVLGDGVTEDRKTPVQIMEDVQSVSVGEFHSMVLKTDGSLWAWGDNGSGQLGDGTTEDHFTPVKIMENVQAVDAGSYYTMAIKNDGSLWAWGSNKSSQLGDGTENDHYSPIKIMEDVKQVSANGSMVVKTDGALWKLADHISPAKMIMEDVRMVSSFSHRNMVVKADGSLWAWGVNFNGEIGNGTYEFQASDEIVLIMEDVRTVCAGGSQTIAIKNDGSLWAWGANTSGQLGDGTTEKRNTPMEIFLTGADTSEKVEGAESTIPPNENNVPAQTPLVLGEVSPEGYGLSMEILDERKAIITITDWALEDKYLIDNEEEGTMEYEWAVCFEGAVDYELSLYTWSRGENPHSSSPQEMECAFWIKEGDKKHTLPFEVPFVVHKSAIVFQLEVPDTVENFNFHDYKSFELDVHKLDEFYTNEFAVL